MKKTLAILAFAILPLLLSACGLNKGGILAFAETRSTGVTFEAPSPTSGGGKAVIGNYSNNLAFMNLTTDKGELIMATYFCGETSLGEAVLCEEIPTIVTKFGTKGEGKGLSIGIDHIVSLGAGGLEVGKGVRAYLTNLNPPAPVVVDDEVDE